MLWGVEIIFGPTRGPVAAADLPDHYPWPERGGAAYVRAMMVCTLDGAGAGADGLSGSISGDADGEVFVAVRRFADAVLVGGGTLKSEEYGPLRSTDEDAARREAAGQASAPVIAVVSQPDRPRGRGRARASGRNPGFPWPLRPPRRRVASSPRPRDPRRRPARPCVHRPPFGAP